MFHPLRKICDARPSCASQGFEADASCVLDSQRICPCFTSVSYRRSRQGCCSSLCARGLSGFQTYREFPSLNHTSKFGLRERSMETLASEVPRPDQRWRENLFNLIVEPYSFFLSSLDQYLLNTTHDLQDGRQNRSPRDGLRHLVTNLILDRIIHEELIFFSFKQYLHVLFLNSKLRNLILIEMSFSSTVMYQTPSFVSHVSIVIVNVSRTQFVNSVQMQIVDRQT